MNKKHSTSGEIKSECIYSRDKTHRYLLKRVWSNDENKTMVAIIMMNPSYANELKYDLTTMRIINYLIDKNNYKGVYILNLYSIIETDSNKLSKSKMNENKNINNKYITKYTKKDKVSKVYKAWGLSEKNNDRAKEIYKMLDENEVDNIYELVDKDNKSKHPSRCVIVGENKIKINKIKK